MKQSFRVHSTHETVVPVAAKTDEGVAVIAQMPVMIVEMIPTQPFQRSFTFIVPTPDSDTLAAARSQYRPDAEVHLTITAAVEG